MNRSKNKKINSLENLNELWSSENPQGKSGKSVVSAKPATNHELPHLSVTLKRTVQLKRYPLIAKVTFLRERQDLVSLLEAMKTEVASMPPRLRAYLHQEALWDDSGITDKGQQVVKTGLFQAKERGLYYIWYTDNDPLLGTRPVLMQQDTAFDEPNLKSWKKGIDAVRSEFRVEIPLQLRVVNSILVDRTRSDIKQNSLQMESLEPEVICSSDKSAEAGLEWTLGMTSSKVSLNGQLDMPQPGRGKSTSAPHELVLDINDFGDQLNELMGVIAQNFKGRWRSEINRIATHLEEIEKYPSAVQKFQIGSYEQNDLKTDFGVFQHAQVKLIPIQPADQSDAEDWHLKWLEEYHNKSYRSSADAAKQQSEWLNHLALNEFELPLKNQQSLLSVFSRERHPKAYWHIAAIADLTPSKSGKLRMPISLVNKDELDIKQLKHQLSGGTSIQKVIFSDRYVHTPRQCRNLKVIADCFEDAEGLLLTLNQPNGIEAKLPDNWTRELLQKQSDNHGRYWILIGNKNIWCWECSSGLDFILENNGSYTVDGAPTFTPKEVKELPQYLQNKINKISIATEAY